MKIEESTFEPTEKKKKSSKILIAVTAILSIIIVGTIGFAFPIDHHSPIYNLEYSSDAPNATMLSGRVDISGRIYGYYGKNVNSSFINVEKITVENGTKKINTFTNANLTIEKGNIEWWINSSTDINASFESAFLVFLNSWDAQNETSMAIFTEENMWINTVRATIKTENCSVKIGDWKNYGDYTIELEGNFSSNHRAEAMWLALSHRESEENFSITINKSPSSIELEEMIEKFDELNESEAKDMEIPPLPFDVNGAAIFADGDNRNATVEGNRVNFTHFCFCRGCFNATFSGKFLLDGKCNLILTDKGFYTNEESYWIIPKKLIGLWPLAIGIWIMTRFIGKSNGMPKETKNKKLKWITLVVHILLLITAFYLWDCEINCLFGKSLIPLITEKRIFNIALTNPLIFIAPIELIPWFICIALIGLPIRILINSILKIWKIDREGKGIGKGIGDMATWFIGAGYILFFLNIIISPIMGLI
jgi:hypothetical protein